MNSDRNLKRRTLKLYPVRILKEHFMLAGSQNDILSEIVNTHSIDQVYNFALDNLKNTKQHIYIFTISRFSEKKFDFVNFPIPVVKHTNTSSGYEIRCMPIVEFKATIKNKDTYDYMEISMMFPQPIVITVTGTHVIIRATIIEKSIVSYLDSPNSLAFNVRKTVSDDFTSRISEYFLINNCQVNRCDLNRGVKHLCDINTLDFRIMKITRDQSVRTESMHGESTFKQSYPGEYDRAMKNPLEKSVFKYLLNDDKLCRNFAIEPNIGKVSVSLFPDDPNQVSNVISQILANN